MQLVHISEIWRQVWSLFDGSDFDTDGMSTEDFANFRNWTNKRLETAWKHHFWPDLVNTEQRYFRYLWPYAPLVDDQNEPILDDEGNFTLVLQTYNATSVLEPVEVFYPPTRKYYQSLRDVNEEPCADSEGVENSDWWAECAASYAGEDWETAAVYGVGDKVRNLDDDRYYQCHTAHTAGATIDYTKFCVLNPFVRYIPQEQIAVSREFIGTVIEVWDRNPETDARAKRIPFTLTKDGTRVTRNVTHVFLEHRRRARRIFGSQFSLTTAYPRKRQVYFTGADGFGDFYDVSITTTAGETPETHPENFLRVEIPAIFHDWLFHGLLADALRSDGQTDKATREEFEAVAGLDGAVIELVGQSRQRRTVEVFTR